MRFSLRGNAQLQVTTLRARCKATISRVPGGIRTPNLLIRSQLLYPVELQTRCDGTVAQWWTITYENAAATDANRLCRCGRNAPSQDGKWPSQRGVEIGSKIDSKRLMSFALRRGVLVYKTTRDILKVRDFLRHRNRRDDVPCEDQVTRKPGHAAPSPAGAAFSGSPDSASGPPACGKEQPPNQSGLAQYSLLSPPGAKVCSPKN